MNIDAKIQHAISSMNIDAESNNTLKGSYTTIKWDLSQECNDSSICANQSM